jgi:hypothetical protein
MPTTGDDLLILGACTLAIAAGLLLFAVGVLIDPARAARRALSTKP